MALTKVQKELWANSIVALYDETSVFGAIVNRNLIRDTMADIWHIVAASDVSIADVNDAADITYNALTDTETQVTPNFDKLMALIDYDTNRTETSINYLPTYIRRGAERLIDALDLSILAAHSEAGSNFTDVSSTDWQFTLSTAANMPAFLAKLAKAEKDLNWPDKAPKYLVAPSGFKEAVLTYTGGRESALGDSDLTTGRSDAFMFGGHNVFISNNCNTETSTTHGLAGVVGDGIALGVQVDPSSVEDMRSENRLGTLYRARLKAGHKTYRSAAVIDVLFNEVVVATS